MDYCKSIAGKNVVTDTNLKAISLMKEKNRVISCIFHINDDIKKSKAGHNDEV